MYATTLNDIENAFLHDAVMMCEMQGFKLRSLYMDKDGECAVSFYGKLTEEQVKNILIQFYLDDVLLDDIHPQYFQDYKYENGHNTDKEGEFTQIFTPDGIDYRTMTNNSGKHDSNYASEFAEISHIDNGVEDYDLF